MLKKLNNMKVQPRLILCFIIVVIMASISGIVGSILLVGTDTQYSNALVENGFSQGDIGRFNTYLNKGGAVVRDIIMLTEKADIEASQKELGELATKTNDALTKVKENCQTSEDLAYISEIEKNLPLYREKRDAVVALGLQNKNEEALALFHKEARPILNSIMESTDALAAYNVTMGETVSVQLTKNTGTTLLVIIAIIVVSAVLSVIFAIYIAKSLATPIKRVQAASAQLAEGDLNIEIKATSKDEVGEMTVAFAQAAAMIKSYIIEIAEKLNEVANSNFNVKIDQEYKGDFGAIKEAITTITVALSDTMHQINEASSQVALGAEQMSESAQSLAEGATEQAGAIEELTATIENVSAMVETSSSNANEAYQQASEYEKEAESSSEEIKELTLAMERISDTSKKIENIIAEIEDIASQTNLLALNAAIEAARAGEAGKGFAVVADQIGKLATDSANSAINTRDLISNAISEVDNGNKITARTSETINKVIAGMKELAKSSKEISDMSISQSESMKQIEQGTEQISGVVQSNSAAAEETSATSEELFAQSQNLKALVDQFKLLS